MKTTIKSMAVISLALVAGIFTGCKNDQRSYNAELAVPVSVKEVRPGSISQFVNTSGNVLASQELAIKSEISGAYILRRNSRTGKPYVLGDKVRKGEVIIRLEDKEYENQQKIESRRLTLETNEQEFKKQKSLYEKGGVTLKELKTSEANLIDARYAYESTLINLEKMVIKAPFDGFVTELPYYTQGTRIESGREMVTVMNYNKVLMEIQLPASAFGQVIAEQRVLVSNYALPKDTLVGEIQQLSPAIDPESRTFKGIISIANKDLKLRPGMFARADLEVDFRDSVIVIPKDMIIIGNRGKTVFVVEKQTAVERRIQTGLENQEEVEVVKGLELNDRLVIKGYETLKNRSKVKVVK